MLWRWLIAITVLTFEGTPTKAADQYAFKISFRDKGRAFSPEDVRQHLTSRALQRRIDMGITLDERDIPVSSKYVEEVLRVTDGSLHLTSRWLNSCVVWVKDTSNIHTIRTKPHVASVELVGLNQASRAGVGNSRKEQTSKQKSAADPTYYGQSWGQTNFVKGDCLHDRGWRGAGKLIAVLDDGFFYVNTAPAFDSLFKSGRILDTRNFSNGGTDVYSDFFAHGTTVLSTMAAILPNTYVGAAPDAQYALYITEISGSETPLEMDNMVAAMERADSIGADIISASLGYNTFDPPFPSIPAAQLDGNSTVAAIGANIASQKGLLVVITAGNEGGGGLLTPGDANEALTVGNVNNNRTPASNSGHGPNAAQRVKPEVCALGQPAAVVSAGFSPFFSSGTSFSTPQIAAWAACLWQGNAGKTNVDIKQAIIKSSSLFPNPQMPQLGYGIPDFCNANTLLDIAVLPASEGISFVYPNPFQNRVNVRVPANYRGSVVLQLTSVTGQQLANTTMVSQGNAERIAWHLPETLVPGIYFCRVQIGDIVQVFRLVKE